MSAQISEGSAPHFANKNAKNSCGLRAVSGSGRVSSTSSLRKGLFFDFFWGCAAPRMEGMGMRGDLLRGEGELPRLALLCWFAAGLFLLPDRRSFTGGSFVSGCSPWKGRDRLYLEPTKFVILRIFGTKFWSNLTILVFLKSWDRDLSKFGKTKLRRDPNFVKIENLGLGLRIQKFGFELGLKISNFKFSIFTKIKNLTENQNSATVVYHNFAILTKFENQNYTKLVLVWAYNRHKIFSKILKSIWTKICKISSKLALITKIFYKKFLKLVRLDVGPAGGGLLGGRRRGNPVLERLLLLRTLDAGALGVIVGGAGRVILCRHRIRAAVRFGTRVWEVLWFFAGLAALAAPALSFRRAFALAFAT